MERWKGEIVWRTPAEVMRNEQYLWDRKLISGNVGTTTTRRGKRSHLCTVVAVYDPNAHRMKRDPWHFASALSRAMYEQSPRGHRSGGGRVILRIEGSTHPHMIGRYLHVGDF